MSPQFEIRLIAVLVAVACALPGAFLVLRKMSMMPNSITHTILLGIVLAFFLTHDLSSPLLLAGAAVVGVAAVWLTEALHRTMLLSEDSSIGIMFPPLFSIANILITRFAGSVHLNTDSVLVVAFMIGPPVTAYLLTDDLKAMLILSAAIGAVNGILGYQLAASPDVSIAGGMAVVAGFSFLPVFLAAPGRGLVSSLRRRRVQRITFAEKTLMFHLCNHEGCKNEEQEAGAGTINQHLRWRTDFTQKIIRRLIHSGMIEVADGVARLTEKGQEKRERDYLELFG